jgi:hypothetical protein
MVFGPSQVEQSAPRIDPSEFLRRVMEAHVAGQRSSEEEQQTFLEDAKIVFERVDGVQQVGSGWSALCPAHDDQRSSLSVAIGGRGKTLVTCHAGCSTQQIVTAAGMRIADLYPPVVATYTYCDENGTLLYEVIRDEARNFRQRHPTVTAGGSG